MSGDWGVKTVKSVKLIELTDLTLQLLTSLSKGAEQHETYYGFREKASSLPKLWKQTRLGYLFRVMAHETKDHLLHSGSNPITVSGLGRTISGTSCNTSSITSALTVATSQLY